jgi:hypothetical protein
LLKHLENGDVSLLDFAIHDVLSLWADHGTGVCRASAQKLSVLCPAGTSYKAIQRSLAKLEELGWIKRWVTPGKRGNYPILVCRYYVRDESMTWRSTSGTNTTDWSDVKLDDVHDPSFNSPRRVRRDVRGVSDEASGEVSGNQDSRVEKPEDTGDGRGNRDASPENGDVPLKSGGAVPPASISESPEAVEKLSYNELKGLRKGLEKSLRDRRLPEAFRDKLRPRLLQVINLMSGKC